MDQLILAPYRIKEAPCMDLFDYLRALCVVAHTVGSKVFDLIIIAVDP